MLKIFYKTHEWDALASHLDAMQKCIHRKKVMGYHRENYLNTIRFVRKLSELNPFDKSESVALRLEIEASKPHL